MSDPIRIVLADDHPLFRRGLATLLSSEPDMEIVGQAGTGSEAVGVALAERADLVLMDLQMPDGGGVSAIRQLASRAPQIRILVVSLFEDADSVFLAMRAGAHGYVLKDTGETELLRAIRGVAAGEAIFSQTIARQVLAWFARPASAAAEALPMLSRREHEVLQEIAAGYSNSMIAQHLSLSTKTVANHVSTILAKLQVPDRNAAIVRARELGYGGATGHERETG
ncbi:MAG TPA: response regulator transcription factor [Thermomicrobiales bacterium]|nr:response regulator transcription factor [Thermomicrobiales bacterium]